MENQDEKGRRQMEELLLGELTPVSRHQQIAVLAAQMGGDVQVG